uniref:Protein translocase subunit SecE n=1 Tax=Candidatus Kentrum sp. DK TaxID=2126562 RepID=A0A450SGS7_9GAMM|nr:MAG: protein translocase subunit secE/sec61 gamma [Candidatus Kentron sp. DK]
MVTRSKDNKTDKKIEKTGSVNKDKVGKKEGNSGIPDGIKWFSAVLILAVAIGGFYYSVDDWPWLLRVVGLIGAFGLAGAILLQATQGRLAWNTIKEARMEVRKVVWPTRKETVQTTMIVVVVVFLMAMVLWLLDGLLGWIMRYLLGQGG